MVKLSPGCADFKGEGTLMAYAIDLNPRQSARTLEQAIRHQATVLLEPRIWTAGSAVHCQLESWPAMSPTGRRMQAAPLVMTTVVTAGDSSAADVPEPRAAFLAFERYSELVGTYCDAVVELGENRYLLSSDITRVEPAGPGGAGARLYLSRPETIQVMQRRRFKRVQLPQAAQVEIRWLNEDGTGGGGVGWLYNVSADGMACRTDSVLAERLWIGQELKLDFALRPGEPEHYLVDAVLCSKTSAGMPDRTILGLQFVSDGDHAASTAARDALRRRLRGIQGSPGGLRKGVDA